MASQASALLSQRLTGGSVNTSGICRTDHHQCSSSYSDYYFHVFSLVVLLKIQKPVS
jgi:hypothetical protein